MIFLRQSASPSRSALRRALSPLCLLACSPVLLFGLAGCKSSPPADDATLTHNVQSSLSSDGSLSGLGVQGSVQGQVATLTGTVANDAQRSLAARDASGVQGIRQVVNNIVVEPQTPAGLPASANAMPAPSAQVPVPIGDTTGRIQPNETRREREQAHEQEARDRERHAEGMRQQQELARQQQEQNSRQQEQAREQAPIQRAPAQPAAPPPPRFRDVTVPSGNTIAVRVTQTLDSATAQQGQTFSGVVANDVMADGLVAIPAGTSISGRVDDVEDAGHFRGNSLLTVSLTSVTRRGDRIPISSEPYTIEGKGRGKNTLEKSGGGAAVGAILGGIFGGGKGAAIGAVAGGGAGAGTNAITRGQQVQIPSESVVRFRLTQPISLHMRVDGQDNGPFNNDPTLQHHPQ